MQLPFALLPYRTLKPAVSRVAASLLLTMVTKCKANQALLVQHLDLANSLFSSYLRICGDGPTQVCCTSRSSDGTRFCHVWLVHSMNSDAAT